MIKTPQNLLLSLVFNLLFLHGYGQDNQLVSPDTVIDFSVSRYRGIKGDGNVVYMLESDNQTLAAYRQQKLLWKANVLNQCGAPAVGDPKIRYLRLQSDQLMIVFGKHDFATINIYTGELTCKGADKRSR